MNPVIFGNRPGQVVDRPVGSLQQGSVMLGHPFQSLPSQVKPVELGIARFVMGHYAQGMPVVIEPAEGPHRSRQRFLAGMAERGVAEIVGQGERLRQILVEPQGSGQRPRDLGHFETVGQARPVMVALVIDEHLGFMLEPAKRRRMDDPVAVALKYGPGRAFPFIPKPAPAVRRVAGMGSAVAQCQVSFRRIRGDRIHGRNLTRAGVPRNAGSL